MLSAGYSLADTIADADIILLNTCSVRENAEKKIRNRLTTIYHQLKKRTTNVVFGVLGCMAERLGEGLIDSGKLINIVVGPDEYRRLPELVANCFEGGSEVAVDLCGREVYGDIVPFRSGGATSFISIMRGCNNFCSYCVVPYTRGRERSRSDLSIFSEVE